MPEFLVESYLARADVATFDDRARRARLAADELNREGLPVRYLRSIFVPEDETCFLFYEASSAEHVEEAARRASLRFERASAVIDDFGQSAGSRMQREDEDE